jgi:predicted ATP-binding protein involved in virulence
MFNHWNIKNLRGVGNVELRFDSEKRVRVLFGSNGVGKTKCLEAIFQALFAASKSVMEQVENYGHNNDWQASPSVELEKIEIFSIKSHYVDLAGHSQGFQHDVPVVFLGASGRSMIDSASSKIDLIGSFQNRKATHIQGLFSAVTNKSMADLGMSSNVHSWFVSRANSVNPYQKDSDNRNVEIETVLEILHFIDERIDPKVLQVDGAGGVSLYIDGSYRELKELSSGFASLIKLVQAIVSGYANFTNEANLRHVSGLVIIDEIESHLHAEWQSKIIPILSRTLPNTTFFIATHSPIVLSQLEQGEAYLLHRDEDGIVRTTEIDSPNKRGFLDVLESGFGIDLNALKHERMLRDDQTDAKSRLLGLLKSKGS